jgi:ribosomal-protein-alanine N-acetyltransferase
MKPPETFELSRLRLRRPVVSDADAIFEYGSDPEVARYADWPLRRSIDGLAASLRERGARWEAGEEFYWVITAAGEDRAIGGISCRVDRDSAELGFLLNRRHWGKGYATEAVGAVAAWALSLPIVNRVWATCDAGNLASARVLEKLGMSLEETLLHAVLRPNLSKEPRDARVYSMVKPPKRITE